MADLSTSYLGLELKNPLVPSSSPLSKHLDSARRLEDAGAAALVMHSLFEEKIEEEDERLARFFHQQSLKSSLQIPVIASLNGTTDGGWVNYAHELEKAGADALELNVYYIPAAQKEDCCAVEQRYIDVLSAVREKVSIPIAMKLSPQFSSLVNFATRLEEAGANGLVLFNRFYQPDIDLETLEVTPQLELSSSEESLLRIRWLAILHGRLQCSLAITGGVHNTRDVLKSLLAGADITHMCSALLRRGPGHLAVVLRSLQEWLEEREYASVRQLKGSVSQRNATDSAAFLRANYVNVLESYRPPAGVQW